MSRVRPRRYRNVATVEFGRSQRLHAGRTIAKLRGQKFGAADRGRKLSPAETAAVTARLRNEGIL
jgi:hypothetical protein